MSHQDWNVVTLRKPGENKPPTRAEANKKAQGTVDHQTEKKFNAGGNKATTGPSNAAKIDAEDTTFTIQTVSHDFKIALMKARQAKGWKQSELAEKINVKPGVITEYENGKAIPDGGVISRLNRVLGVTLPKIQKPKKAAEDN